MNCKYTNLQKELIENCILCFIPKNKRGFASQFEMADIFKCIVHKLKTGCQWSFLFVDIEYCKPHFLGKLFIITIGNGVKWESLKRCLKRIWK